MNAYSHSTRIPEDMRKQPKQERSRRVVNDLVDATAQVIAERGLDQATTNHIAERAGVSVGSLYQYFEGKDDLIDALLLRLSRELSAAIDATLEEVMDRDVETVVRGLLTTALAAMQAREGLYLELTRNWHRLHSLAGVNALEKHMQEACRRYVLRNHERLRVGNLPATLFVVINSTLFTVMRYLTLRHPPVTQQELVDNLSHMIAAHSERA